MWIFYKQGYFTYIAHMNKKERRLAAIMFTDIVGYSSMMQKDEEYTSRLRARHREVFNRLHEQFGGQVIQYFGDGTLSIFPSAAAAVECAVALQQAMKRNPKVPLRIGIHTGDITFNDEDAYGDGVNVAARIEALCVPGGVFISGKVYDDIKNHSRLKAKSLGEFTLKNIYQSVEIYTITNKGVTVPEYEWNKPKPVGKPSKNKHRKSTRQNTTQSQKGGGKSKWAAGLLAFFFGPLGVHRFYLGQRKLGILFLTLFSLFIFVLPDMAQFIAVLGFIAFIDFIIFFTMPKHAFDAKYNNIDTSSKQESYFPEEQTDVADPKQMLSDQFEDYKGRGIKAYRSYDYDEAIHFFQKAIEIKYDDPEVHFLIARCYSVNEAAQKAISHLDVAVAFGLKDPERISTHPDLAYMRTDAEYDQFKENGYRLPKAPPPLNPDLFDPDSTDEPDLLAQLNELQRQWESGILTDEEYLLLQQRIKSGNI